MLIIWKSVFDVALSMTIKSSSWKRGQTIGHYTKTRTDEWWRSVERLRQLPNPICPWNKDSKRRPPGEEEAHHSPLNVPLFYDKSANSALWNVSWWISFFTWLKKRKRNEKSKSTSSWIDLCRRRRRRRRRRENRISCGWQWLRDFDAFRWRGVAQ